MNTLPRTPVHAVDRPRLRHRLDEATGAPMSLVVAPVGSGKTVLLSQWVESRPDLGFVWLDLDAADSDPQRFIDRLLDVMQAQTNARPEPASPHAPAEEGLGQPALDALLTVFRQHPGMTLIIDDVHTVSNSAILADLWWLADHLPEHAHMVLSSRGDLRFPRSPHRPGHSALELRQADLAMDEECAAALLERIVGAPVSDTTLSAVMERTEGWPAGVQLTALGLRNRTDPERFARQLRGTDRLIADYLSEQALAQQPPARRDLLLQLSALDRMSAGLIESVLEVDDAAALLDELQRESMFLVALDDHQEWFRFHHLFRELLHHRLRARHDQDERRLLVSAAQWHLNRDELPAAIDYLLRAREWDRTLRAREPAPSRATARPPRTMAPPHMMASPHLTEQLTDRELEILAYLPSRMTNTELAARCFVSVNTIKTHTAHIYRKLSVANRNGAVARAEELGFL